MAVRSDSVRRSALTKKGLKHLQYQIGHMADDGVRRSALTKKGLKLSELPHNACPPQKRSKKCPDEEGIETIWPRRKRPSSSSSVRRSALTKKGLKLHRCHP